MFTLGKLDGITKQDWLSIKRILGKKIWQKLMTTISIKKRRWLSMSSLGQPKVNKVKFFLPCSEVMKRPQTKFQVDSIRGFKVIKSRKSQNLALGQKNFSTFSSRH